MNRIREDEFTKEKQSIEFQLTPLEAEKLSKLLPKGIVLQGNRYNNRNRKSRNFMSPYEPSQIPTKIERQKRNAFAEAERTIKGTSKVYKRIENILMRMEQEECAKPFIDGRLKYAAPAPIDIKKLWRNLKEHKYEEMKDFEDDISQIWDHYLEISPVKSLLHNKALTFRNFYYTIIQKKNTIVKPLPVKAIREEPQDDFTNGFIIQKKLQQERLIMKEMNEEEKDNLIKMIKKLPQEYLWGVWDIVAEESSQENAEELEFDVEKLSIKVARELERYAKESLNKMKTKKKHGVVRKVSYDFFKKENPSYNPIDRARRSYI